MRLWARRTRKGFLTEEQVVKWLTTVTLPTSRQYYVAHANVISSELVQQFVTIAQITVFTKADVYSSDSLAVLATHRELLAALEMAMLVNTPGVFVGYGPSTLSFYVKEARSERGQQSLDYQLDATRQDPYARPPDSMVESINSGTVTLRKKSNLPEIIAIWANVLTDQAYGGSAIFLDTLRQEFKRRGHTVVHNSHDNGRARLHILNQNSFPKEKFVTIAPDIRASGARIVMRTDGPFFLHRGAAAISQDRALYSFAHDYATDIVYQSEWSRWITEARALDAAASASINRQVIGNAAEPEYFYPRALSASQESGVLKLCFSSYSGSVRKNNQLLLDLVPKLDYSRFSLTVIGSWPLAKPPSVTFIPKLSQQRLGEQLRKHDVYLALSWDECFSNSEVQAIATGLPVVALNDSSHPEVVQNGGVLFGSHGTHGNVEDLVWPSVNMCSQGSSSSAGGSAELHVFALRRDKSQASKVRHRRYCQPVP